MGMKEHPMMKNVLTKTNCFPCNCTSSKNNKTIGKKSPYNDEEEETSEDDEDDDEEIIEELLTKRT
jgi:hypothetical protein